MTEQEWLECADPTTMLRFLGGRTSDRQLRLFAVACCRQVWDLLTDPRSRRVVEMVEQYEDDQVDGEALDQAAEAADDATEAIVAAAYGTTPYSAETLARQAAAWLPALDWPVHEVAAEVATFAADALQVSRGPVLPGFAPAEVFKIQCDWLRDISGNPFRPVTVDPAWLTSTVTSLAQAIYEERAFDRLPILADALEDAGCDNADILNHCRQPGEHVRGCWAVDLVLGRS